MPGLSNKNSDLPNSLLDEFAANTLKAIFSSVLKKPYYDLLELLNVYTFAEVIDIYSKFYPRNDIAGTLKALSNFNEVELVKESAGLRPDEWDAVKDKISSEIKNYIRLLQRRSNGQEIN